MNTGCVERGITRAKKKREKREIQRELESERDKKDRETKQNEMQREREREEKFGVLSHLFRTTYNSNSRYVMLGRHIQTGI